jgi:hypothetical protein
MEPVMNGRRRVLAAAGLVLLGSLLTAGLVEARVQEAPPTSMKADTARAGTESPAAARPAKERMAVDVLVGWVWLSIGVLLWILRLRIREADRVYRMDLVRAGESSPEGPGH